MKVDWERKKSWWYAKVPSEDSGPRQHCKIIIVLEPKS